MIPYDQNILEVYADSLYRQAESIILSMAIKYGLVTFGVGLIATFALQSQMRQIPSNTWLALLLIITVLGIWAGVAAGKQKAFQLKLQAQQILCQRQIEMNTRKSV